MPKTTVRESQLSSGMASDDELAAATSAHVAAGDPHTQYLNTDRGDARYDALGAASAASASSSIGKVDKSGFPTDANGAYYVDLTYNETTRTVTVTPIAATFDIFAAGTRYTKTGAQSIQHPDTQGAHFIYYDGSGTLVATTTPWTLGQHAPVCFVFWDSTNNVSIPFFELHHAETNAWLHKRLHDVDGTQVVGTSGFALSGYALGVQGDASVTFGVSSGTLADEDIRVVTSAMPDSGPYTVIERTGSGSDWRLTRNLTVPAVLSGSSLAYNQNNGGTWQRTAVANNYYVNYYLLAVPALAANKVTPTPASPLQYVLVPGQQTYVTLAAAQAESIASLNWGTLPFQEMVGIYQLTFLYKTANTGTLKSTLEGTARLQGTKTAFASNQQTAHGALLGLSSDDHPQYLTTARGDALYAADTGIVAGTYSGITFNAKGKATAATAATSGSYSTVITAWTLVSGDIYSAVVTHNLGTRDISVDLWDATNNQKVSVDSITATSTNTVTVVIVGTTVNVRCVVMANAHSVVSANAFGIQDEGSSVGSFNTLNFAGKALVVTDAGGGVATVTDTNPLRVFTYYPGAFNVPNSSDWAVNANAGVLADPTNVGINVQSFSNSAEQGVGFNVSVPVGATNVLFRIRGRAATAQGSVQVVQHKVYNRQIGTGAAMAAWSSAAALTPISIPTNAFYQTSTQTVTLASLGLAAGNMYQLEFTRAVTPSSGTQLAANWLLAEVTVEFS